MTKFNTVHILVVEDNEDDYYFIRKALENNKYELSHISSGKQAFEHLVQENCIYDIVLLDCQLPEMSGIEILENLNALNASCSFIFLSIDKSIDTVVKAMKAGALDFIIKSSSLNDELPKKIEKVLKIRADKKQNQETQANLASFFDSTTDAIWSVDTNYNYKFYNKTYESNILRDFNISISPGKNILSPFPKDVQEFWKEKYSSAFNGNKARFDYSYEHAGSYQHRDVCLSPVRINDKVVGVTAVSRNVNTQKEAADEQNKLVKNLKSLWNLAKAEHENTSSLAGQVLEEINSISESKFSFYGFLYKDESVMRIYSWSRNTMKECGMGNKPMDYTIADCGLWAEAVRQRKTIVVNNYSKVTVGKHGLPDGHLDITRFVAVPVFTNHKIVALAAVANKESDYTESDVQLLESFLYNAQNIANQKLILEELNLERHYLQRAQEIGKIGTWSLDIENNILEWTDENYKIFEKEKGLFLNYQDFLNCVHPLDRDYVHREWSAAIKGKPYEIEHRLMLNGKIKWVREKADVEFDDAGKAVKAIGFTQDITEQKLQEEKLQQLNKDISLIYDHDPAFIILKDIKNNILRVSNKVAEMKGLSKDEIEGKPLKNIFPEMAEQFYADDKEVINNKKPKSGIIEELVDANGQRKWLLTNKIPIVEKGKVSKIILFSTDITELKKKEREILEQKIMFETMFNTITDGVVITNTDREVILANNGMKDTFGYTPDELIGKNTAVLYANDKRFKDTGKAIFGENARSNTKHYITQYKNKNGRIFPGETFGSKLFNNEGTWIGNIGVMRDVTEREEYISALKKERDKAERADKLKTIFLANMSHEIRTPLNGLIGFADIMAKKNDLTKDQRNFYGEIIRKSGDNLLHIVNDILDISALENGTLEIVYKEVEINPLLEKIYNIYKQKFIANEKQLTLNVLTCIDNLVLSIDESRLTQVFTNLLDNASKFTHVGGIEFGVHEVNSNQIIFFVKDTGIGIETENHDVIFDRFRQAEISSNRVYGGNGLGLSIVKEILKLMSGEIWLESKINEGSVFYFSIPCGKELKSKNGIEKKIVNDGEVLETIRKINILLVEDDYINLMYILEILSGIETNVTAVKKGEDAIREAKSSLFDLILMDIRLPDISGFDVTKEIRKFNKHVPIIAQTAYAMDSDREEALRCGCTDYISKPIKEDLLMEKIKDIVPYHTI